MKFQTRAHRGFTLLELLVVITIIAILAGALFPVFGYFRKKARAMLAKNTMSNITMALTQYRQDWEAYPPDNTPSSNGSEMIAYYLARVLKTQDGGMHYGPYLKIQENQLVNSDGSTGGDGTALRKFLSPLGGEYKYMVQLDSKGKQYAYVLVDPGGDKEFGGEVNPSTGFTIDDEKKAADNIYNEAQFQPGK